MLPRGNNDLSSQGRATLWLCIGLLVVAVLGGGGQGGLGDVCAQLIALVLLARLAWLGANDRLNWRAKGAWIRWLPVLAVALPILQLLPIPAGLWSAAPARAELAAQLASVGVVPSHVISLNPGATEQALWWLLPPVALFLATLALSRTGHRLLLAAVLALALLSVLLGMAQMAGGPQSALRFYSNTNPDNAVGFFANRNHLASLLVMALPLTLVATAWALTEKMEGERISPIWILGGSGLAILLILGIALTRSRAGLVLGMLGVLGALPLALGLRQQRGVRRIIALVVGIAIMLSVQFSLLGILQRLDSDPLDDVRWQFAQVTREAAAAYAPLGSGLGTFRQAYQPFEARHQPDRDIVNHAHDDYLELWLEGGVPALVLLALGALAWLWRGVQLFWPRNRDRTESGQPSRLFARVAWLAATLPLLHSAMDYPLRTTANLCVFAVLAAIAFCDSARNNPSR